MLDAYSQCTAHSRQAMKKGELEERRVGVDDEHASAAVVAGVVGVLFPVVAAVLFLLVVGVLFLVFSVSSVAAAGNAVEGVRVADGTAHTDTLALALLASTSFTLRMSSCFEALLEVGGSYVCDIVKPEAHGRVSTYGKEGSKS